jgi:C-terminal processing protease CtpA/Prc
MLINKSESLKTEMKKEVLIELMDNLSKYYVFPDVAEVINEKINDFIVSKEFDKLTDPQTFCRVLNEILQSVNHDKHLRIRFIEKMDISDEEEEPEYEEGTWKNNFGFSKIEILPNNIGYMNLKIFDSPRLAGETAVQAMGFVKHTDALIIDLRENGGGDPDMVSLLMSYFVEESIHHTTFFNRIDNQMIQFWTTEFVPGDKYLNKPLYLLTSRRTFSAAESFAFNLNHLKKVVIVGERTGGGAQPGRSHKLSHNFEVFISHGMAINPETNSNWEGNGVTPHIVVDSQDALTVAYENIVVKEK